MRRASGAAPDHPAAGQARDHRRLDPGLHPLARRLCDAAGAGRRQEHDARQPDRAAIRPGPQLAARCGAVDHADGHRHGGAARSMSAMSRDRGPAMARRVRIGFPAAPDRLLDHAMLCFFLLYLPIATLGRLSPSTPATRWRSGRDSPGAGISRPGTTRQVHRCLAPLAASSRSMAAVLATIAATMAALATTRTAPFRGLTVQVCLHQPAADGARDRHRPSRCSSSFATIKVWTGYTGLGYLIAAHTAFCIPFAYLPIRARLESMDLSLESAAADLYATPWQTFRRVTLPLLWPGIIAGLMLAFVISLDDVVITELVKSGGQETLPTYMLGQLRRDRDPGNQCDFDRVPAALGHASSRSSSSSARDKTASNAQQGESHEVETARPRYSALALLAGGRHGARRRRAQHLQLGQLHQPRTDQEVRGRATRSRSPSPTTIRTTPRSPRCAPGGHGFDIVVPSASYVPIWVERRPAARRRAPTRWRTSRTWIRTWVDVALDPGRHYSVPWQWGTTGVTVNTSVYKGDLNTSAIFLDPPEELVGQGQRRAGNERRDVPRHPLCRRRTAAPPTRRC